MAKRTLPSNKENSPESLVTTSTPESGSSSGSSPELTVQVSPRKKQTQRKARVACGECQDKKRACVGLVVLSQGGKGKEREEASWMDCEGCTKRGLRCSGPVTHLPTPKTRSGAVITSLRQSLPVLSVLHPAQAIPALHLSYSLQYHLLQAATGDTRPADWIPLIRMGRICDKFRSRKTQTQIHGKADFENIMLASLLALGSRRSTHSAITGVNKPKGYLGPERESICLQLTNRTINLVESSRRSLFDEDGCNEGMEVAVMLRGVLQCVASDHPYTKNLVALTNNQRNGVLRTLDPDNPLKRFVKDCLGDSVVSFDAFMSSKGNTPSSLTETDLKKRYGWGKKKIDLAWERIGEWEMNDVEDLEQEIELLVENFRVVTTGILRESLVVRRSITDVTQAEANEVTIQNWFKQFATLSKFLETFSFPSSRNTPYLYSIPTLTSLQVFLVFNTLTPKSSHKQEAQKIFLGLAEKLIDALDRQELFFENLAGIHSMAMILGEFEVLDGWVKMMVENLDRGRLYKLSRCLRYSADIFGTLATRANELRELLGEEEVEPEKGLAMVIVEETVWDLGR